MSHRFKKLVVIFVSVTMLAGIIPTSVSASSAKAPEQNSSSVASLEKSLKSSVSAPSLKITNDHPAIAASVFNNAKPLGKSNANQIPTVSFKAMADAAATDTPTQYNLTGSILSNTAALTSSSSQNYYTFSVPNNRYMILGLASTNVNYYVQLYQYQASTGKYAATNVIIASGKTYTLSTLPTGKYLLAIFSTGTVGNNYTIVMNASAPASPSLIYYASFAKMICGYPNSLYVNDSAIFSGNAENGTALDWHYSYGTTDGPFYEGVDHFLDCIKINTSLPIVRVKNYKTSYSSSADALFIPVGGGTNFVFQHVKIYNNITTLDSWDYNGIQTPTTLSDAQLLGDNYLVFDLATCKTVDYYGTFNYRMNNLGEKPTFTLAN